MPRSYDLVVLGAGTAAMTAASRVRDQGWSVAVIDFRPFGGTCALRGCDPKKMLIGGTSAVDHARRMRGKGVADDARIDWSELMAFKRSFTDPVPELHERNYKSKGIDTFHGKARFTGRQTIEVAGEVLDARYVLLATGAEPVKLGIPGEEHLVTNEQFLSLEALPARIAFVGGGYIAAEFAHIAALSGAKVTVLQHGPRMLKAFDKDLVGWLMAKFQALGIDVRTGTSVERVDQPAHEFRVWTSRDGQKQSIEADLVVHAAGRAPDFSGLNLEAAGVEVDGGRLKLNEFLQSVSNPAVYAAGDAAQVGPPLTPVSSHDAHIVAANMLKGNARRPDYRGVPSVAFTVPPIAAVGLSEEKARAQGLKFRVQSKLASTWFTARQAAEAVYGFKVLVDETTDLVLGAHLVGPHAEEVINLFALAIRHGLTASALKQTMFAYPTGASDIGYML
ncbi:MULTISPECIES: NAD(P)/FAD-dependent oxidoreductase [unclassified Hydrogenophaga]|uniref:dihydrolipoyl dehydrogenase family protein n=1 Tax=unclassified Hydrogenophaga TaxID=2610897 RepID=UPI0009670F5E|nr:MULTISPECIES: NAD(P)/FAD-dependent oxidoreductase [unclassified Hydrogenophaga]MBN9373519.1 NAD(P)/FAD-dependent oxidoreductase [Hydrogenophaga sp.]OJV36651.1 MAG: pyridine nucleotide-disulfide oxidoreductase [Hydrogenophaga sp. 70-12]